MLKAILEFDQIYKENHRQIYNYCYKILRNKFDAEDITQEVFMIFYEKMCDSKYEWRNIFGFLIKIARNKCLTLKRFKKNHGNQLFEYSFLSSKPNYLFDLEEEVEKKLNKIKPVYQECFNLRLQGFKSCEIAELLNVTNNQARVIIHRTRCFLKIQLNEFNLN